MIKKAIKKNVSKLLGYRYPQLLTSDVLLASYPKSGNTWMSFLIANCIICHRQIDRTVNWFNIGEIVQGMDRNVDLTQSGFLGETDLPRIIKTHQINQGSYQRAILVVRDPRDVLTSHFHYTKNYNLHDLDFHEFIRSENYGILNWVKHSKSWMRNGPGFNIYTVKYESLKDNTGVELSKVMKLLGLDVLDETISKAVTLSSKDNMRSLEATTRANTINSEQAYSFVRQGEATRGGEMDSRDNEFVIDMAGDLMERLGYEI